MPPTQTYAFYTLCYAYEYNCLSIMNQVNLHFYKWIKQY